MKICSRCNTEKPLEDFARQSTGKNGRTADCSVCRRAIGAVYRLANAEKIKATTARYRKEHADVKKASSDRYRDTHKERIRERKKQYSKQNSEKINIYGLAYRQCNKEAERVRRSVYKKANKGKINASTARRYAAKLRAIPSWADKEMIETVYTKAKQFGLQVDHIVPLRSPLVCGLHVWDNLQLLAKRENVSKNNRYWPDMPEVA